MSVPVGIARTPLARRARDRRATSGFAGWTPLAPPPPRVPLLGWPRRAALSSPGALSPSLPNTGANGREGDGSADDDRTAAHRHRDQADGTGTKARRGHHPNGEGRARRGGGQGALVGSSLCRN